MKHIVLLIATLLIALHGNAQHRGAWTRLTAPAKPMHLAAHHPDRGNAPANDDCANAEAITVTTDCASPVSGNNAEATQDGGIPSCDNTGTWLDVWYTFNSGAADTVTITLTPGAGMTDRVLAVYDACGGDELLCAIAPPGPIALDVEPGVDYWIRVHSNTDYGVGGDFTLCVTVGNTTPAPPVNDLCSGAIEQALSIGGTITFNGDNTGATDSEGLGYTSAWEAFTLAACADVHLSYCGSTPAWDGFWILLYSSCPPSTAVEVSSYDSTSCGDGNFTLCFPQLPAGTYYFPVVAGPIGPYTLVVSAAACGSDQAPNDECDGAIPLTAQPTCDPTYFTNPCATQSLVAVTCGSFTGDAGDDVWYSFTATAPDMTVGGAPHGNMDIVMELFSGACGLLTSIACGDVGGSGVADDMYATGLTVGDTYYFRVYDFRSQYAYAEPGYDLCVVEGLGSGVGLAESTLSSGQPAIYPNPTDGVFTLRSNGSSYVVITVIDASARSVLNTTRNANAGLVQVDATSLQPGAYVVRCTSGGVLTNERLIIR
ncbi:MAG: T9SS type A sorting domain-containing protein [Flavobacteriales bacterium]